MDELSGFIAEFDKAMVVHNDIRYFGRARRELLELTVKYRHLNALELLVNGYDEDPRSLYEVPEVRRWMTEVREHYPDLLFWLTPGSLWVACLCLNPDMHSRLPDGRGRIELDTDRLLLQFDKSTVEAGGLLADAGLSDDDIVVVATQAHANLFQMFERKQLGQYVVVHPVHGDVVRYRSGP
jgi:hypothetical protein